jgi:hypothetical protein
MQISTVCSRPLAAREVPNNGSKSGGARTPPPRTGGTGEASTSSRTSSLGGTTQRYWRTRRTAALRMRKRGELVVSAVTATTTTTAAAAGEAVSLEMGTGDRVRLGVKDLCEISFGRKITALATGPEVTCDHYYSATVSIKPAPASHRRQSSIFR